MSITVRYADFIRLFRIDDPKNWLSGLDVRTDGVYAIEPAGDIHLLPEERATLTDHPTGDLTEPVLPFPFDLDDLESFVDQYELSGSIDPFDLLRFVKVKAFTNAIAKLSEEQTYNWPIVSGILDIRDWVKQGIEIESGKANRDSSSIVAMREFKEKLDALFPGPESAQQELATQLSQSKQWPWGKHETKLLQSLAAAAKHWWENYDPADMTTAPTNAKVSSWLQSQCGVAQRTAEIIATILRADGLPTGPRK